MKQHSKPAHHTPRKPIAERYQTAIAGAATIALIAGLVVVFGYGVPYAPMPNKPRPALSLQEVRR